MVSLLSHFKYSRTKTSRHIVHLVVLVSLSFCFVCSVNAQTAPTNGFRLIGTIVSGSFTGAVIADTTGTQSLYRLNEKLSSGQQIIDVKDDSISLKGPDGSIFTMYIAHDMKSTASAGTIPENNPRPDVKFPAPVTPSPAYSRRVP